jgi:hypothetical protein
MMGCFLLSLASALLLLGCADSASPPGPVLRTTTMQIGRSSFALEIADTGPTRARGLMRRDSMPRDHGMIFVFPEAEPQAFWMKNTRIPLDIIYVDAGGKVVSCHSMKPYDLTTTPSDGPAKYAIELNAGVVAETGVKPGDVLAIPPEAREPAQ